MHPHAHLVQTKSTVHLQAQVSPADVEEIARAPDPAAHTVIMTLAPRRRTRSFLLTGVALLSLISACISIEGDDDDATSPTPQCTLPPANDTHVTLQLTDAEAFEGNPVSMRLARDGGGITCTSSMVPAGGALELSRDAFGPMGGLTAELVLSSDTDPAHSAGDLTRLFEVGVDGTLTYESPCSVPVDWDLTFSATEDAPSAITWELGTACPGDPP